MIDAHPHLWRYSAREYPWIADGMEVLRRDFLMKDLRPLAKTAGVTGLVAVQACQSIEETSLLLEQADEPEEIVGVPWKELMTELAARSNVWCKVSGMVTEADWTRWTEADLRPYFDVALSTFGPRRLMFGSDWPVLTLGCAYGRWVEIFRSFCAALSADERAWMEERTARQAYGLG